MARIVIEITDSIADSVQKKIRQIGDTAVDAEKAINVLGSSIKKLSDSTNSYLGVAERFVGAEAKKANALRESIRFLNEQNKALDERANKERILAESIPVAKEIARGNALKETIRFTNELNETLRQFLLLLAQEDYSKREAGKKALQDSTRFLKENNEELRKRALEQAKLDNANRIGKLQEEAIAYNNIKNSLRALNDELRRKQIEDAKAEASARANTSTGRFNARADKVRGLGLDIGSTVSSDASKFEAARLQVLKDGYVSLDKAIEKTNGSLFTFHNLFIAFAVIRIADKVTEIVDAYTLMENKLKLVSTSAENTIFLQKELFKIANETRSPVAELTQSFVRFDYSLKGLGATQKESLRFTKTLAEQLAISGLTTMEQSSALLQLSQALNKGKLDGDEFRTVMETLPTVATAIAKEMGVARGELIKLAPQGKITSDIIRKAMSSIAEDTDKAFKNLTPTIGQAFTVLLNNVIQTTGEFNKFTSASKVIAESIIFLTKQLDVLALAMAIAASVIVVKYIGSLNAATLAQIKLNTAILANPYVLLAVATGIATLSLRDYLKTTNEINEETDKANTLIEEQIQLAKIQTSERLKLVNSFEAQSNAIKQASRDLEETNANYKKVVESANKLVLEDTFLSETEMTKFKKEQLERQIEDKVKFYDEQLETLRIAGKNDIAIQIADSDRVFALERARAQAIKDLVDPQAAKDRKESKEQEVNILKSVNRELREYELTLKVLNGLIKNDKINQKQYNDELNKTTLMQQKLKILKDSEIKPDKKDFSQRISEIEAEGQKKFEEASRLADALKLNDTERLQLDSVIIKKVISDILLIEGEKEKSHQNDLDRIAEISSASEKQAIKIGKEIDENDKKRALGILKSLEDIKAQSLALDLASGRINKGLGENSGPGAKADLAKEQARNQLFDDLAKNANALEDAKVARAKATAEQIADIDRKLAEERMNLAANLFGTLSSLADKFVTGHGKRARIAFEVSRGLAYAEAVLNMASAISKANATTGLYDKAVAIASAVTVGANAIASIKQAEAPKFARGQVDIGGTGTSTSDSMLAYIGRGESVINANSTRKHKDLLSAINNDTSSTSSINNTYLGSNQKGQAPTIVINNNTGSEFNPSSNYNADTNTMELTFEKFETKLAQKYADGNGKLAKAIDGKRLRNY